MNRFLVIGAVSLLFIFNGCAQLQQAMNTLSSLQRLKFKLANVAGFSAAGINLSNKSSISDFNPLTDGLSLLNAYRNKSLPATFTLNMNVNNPNDGSNGTRNAPASLAGLDFRLLIDGKPTINGDIAQPFEIPAGGSGSVVPISISLDLFKFFGDQGYNDVINLALALGGQNGSASRITLDARPTVRTSFGDIQYPSRINIVDKQFTN